MKLRNLTHFSFKQLLRTPIKLVLYIMLPALVSAFLCLGLNLRQYAADNLDAVYNAFEIVAVPDFTANINSQGALCDDMTAEDYVGFFSCEAENYDLTQLSQLEGVTNYDVRNQFGAYVANEGAKLYQNTWCWNIHENYRAAVFCFSIAKSEPCVFEAKTSIELPVYVKWAAADDSDAPESVLRNLGMANNTEQTFILEPGKEYIALLNRWHGLGTDVYHLADLKDEAVSSFFYVSKNGEYVYDMDSVFIFQPISDVPFSPLVEYYDGFWQTEQGDYFRQTAEALEYTSHALTAVTVNDLSGVPAFYNNKVWVSQGREFTEEELQSGAKVCLISNWLANHMGWKVGDTIDMNFFPCDYVYAAGDYGQYSVCRQDTIEASPIYHPDEADYSSRYHDFPSMHIFDQGEYEIIGIYDGLVGHGLVRDDSDMLHETHKSTNGEGVYFMNVYIPSNSVANQPTPKLSENNTTLWINPKKLLDFQAALESSGLTARQETGYTMNVTVYDHNLSQLAPGIESLSQISKLILVLSGLTSLLTVIAFAVLYMVQNKRQIAAFRAIGMSKRQVAVLLLFAVLLVCILGAGAGAFAGQKISAQVTQSILETAAENRSDPSFSATIADADEDAEAFTYLEQENPLFPIFTWAGISLALIIAMLICFMNESKKSPMLLLGAKE